MLSIQCRKCGYVQDAGSAIVPNDTWGRCGTPIFGPGAWNPRTMAVLSVATFIGSALLGMPKFFLVISGGLTVFFALVAVAKRKR
jgi:hypothetical protein